MTFEETTLEKLAENSSIQEQVIPEPVFITWCADLARLEKACLMQNKEQKTNFLENLHIAAIVEVIAAQSAALEVESRGLGMCYIG